MRLSVVGPNWLLAIGNVADPARLYAGDCIRIVKPIAYYVKTIPVSPSERVKDTMVVLLFRVWSVTLKRHLIASTVIWELSCSSQTKRCLADGTLFVRS